MVEIMRRYRIITIEDTIELPSRELCKLGYNIQQLKVASALTKGTNEVPADEGIRTTLRLGDSSLIVGEVRSSLRGDQEVLIVRNNILERVAIKSLEGESTESILVPTLDKENKMSLKKLTGFVKHPKREKLIKITTKTGREITVTPDHSVFTHVNFKIAAINTDKLKSGDAIIIPSRIPSGYNNIDHLNLLELFRGKYQLENQIETQSEKEKKKQSEKKKNIEKEYRLENAENYIRKAIKKIGWRKASEICKIKDIYRYLLSTQKTRIPISSFLNLMKYSKTEYDLEDLRIKKGTANSIPAKFPINENTMRLVGYYLAEGNCDVNRIQITNSKPKIIEDIAQICKNELGLSIKTREIKGLGSSVQIYINSKPLSDLFMHLGCGKTSALKRIPSLAYGLNDKKICGLLRGMYSGDGSFSTSESAGNMIRYFSTSKDLVNDVAYSLLSLGIVCRLHKRAPSKLGKRTMHIAEIKKREYIEKFLEKVGFAHKNPIIKNKSFAHSKDDSVMFDIKELEKDLILPREYRHLRRTKCCSKDYLRNITDRIRSSNELYDFAHGEFFIDKVKSLEIINLKEPEYVYDLSVKSTERFIGGFGGILLHNTEALALYEAMRVGALANVVAGTIHGDSAYGVFDRVVNDLGVPRTSFKATDAVIIANPIKSADGIHKWRRVTQITEVRKHWEQDPLQEGGFVDLMKYDPIKDELVPSKDLLNGESDILKSIASKVKEWAGNWDAVWENINLRAEMKKAMVDISDKAENPELLEAKFVIKANDLFHQISDEVRNEVGSLDSKMIYSKWHNWLVNSAKINSLKKL